MVADSNSQLDDDQIFAGQTILKQNIEFIEIPLKATYKLSNRQVNIGITGGISAGLLVGNKATLLGNGSRIGTGETSKLRNMVYSGSVGFELSYEITNRLTFTVEPHLKRYLNFLSSHKSVTFKPDFLEISTGLTYSFN